MLENLSTPFYNKNYIPIYSNTRYCVYLYNIMSNTLYVPTWLYINQQHIKPSER